MKERLDLLLRVCAMGYALLYVLTFCVLSFTPDGHFFHMIDTVFLYDSFFFFFVYAQGIKGLEDIPYEVFITITVLFGIRWFIFGKTYEK